MERTDSAMCDLSSGSRKKTQTGFFLPVKVKLFAQDSNSLEYAKGKCNDCVCLRDEPAVCIEGGSVHAKDTH